MRIEIGRGEKEKEKRKEICPFNEEEIVADAFRTSPFIVTIKEFEETLNDKGAPIDEDRRTKGK